MLVGAPLGPVRGSLRYRPHRDMKFVVTRRGVQVQPRWVSLLHVGFSTETFVAYLNLATQFVLLQ